MDIIVCKEIYGKGWRRKYGTPKQFGIKKSVLYYVYCIYSIN